MHFACQSFCMYRILGERKEIFVSGNVLCLKNCSFPFMASVLYYWSGQLGDRLYAIVPATIAKYASYQW